MGMAALADGMEVSMVSIVQAVFMAASLWLVAHL